MGFICPCSLGTVEGGSSWLAGTELECMAGGVETEGTSHNHSCMEEEDLKKREFNSAGLKGLEGFFSVFKLMKLKEKEINSIVV